MRRLKKTGSHRRANQTGRTLFGVERSKQGKGKIRPGPPKRAKQCRCPLVKARIEQREGRLDDAEKTYRQLLDLDSKRLLTYYEFAGLQLLKKDPASAEALLQKALAIDSKSVESHVTLARFYHYNRQPAEAEAFYQKRSPSPLRTNRSILPLRIFIRLKNGRRRRKPNS